MYLSLFLIKQGTLLCKKQKKISRTPPVIGKTKSILRINILSSCIVNASYLFIHHAHETTYTTMQEYTANLPHSLLIFMQPIILIAYLLHLKFYFLFSLILYFFVWWKIMTCCAIKVIYYIVYEIPQNQNHIESRTRTENIYTRK